MVRRMFGALLGGLLLSAGLIAAPAFADPPSDQPLPGYTIDNPPLEPLVVNGVPTQVLQGVYNNAAYVIEVPPQWNGELVMWAHGYRGNGTVLTVDPPGYGLRERFVQQGYAWAAAWDELVGWVEARATDPSAKALEGDPVTDRAAVADAAFGCRFSDPAAYGTGSRPLYPPCPAV